MDLKKIIRDVPDFPKPGILFRDITTVLETPEAFEQALEQLEALLDDVDFDVLAAIESRGFLFAAPMAASMGKKLVILRKPGKLPVETEKVSYDLEYGQATLEVHKQSLTAGERVVVVDDLLATGGTAAAAGELVRRLGADVAGYLFLVELDDLGGRAPLTDAPVFSLVNYD